MNSKTRIGAALFMAVGFPAFAAESKVSNAAEITAAMRTALPGDVLLMANGVWRDADIIFEGQGTAPAPITLRAETPGQVILSGQSRLRVAGSHLVVEGLRFKDGSVPSGDVIAFRASSSKHANHCRVTQCAITDYNPPAKAADTKWISLYGASNRVDHCYFRGKNNSGPTLVVWVGDAPNHHRIDHNHFGPRPPLGANGGETIRVGTSDVSMNDSRTVVESNLFQECNGEGEIISNKSCENTYRYNTFLNSEGALTLRHGNRCMVAGNFFLGNGKRHTGGVRVIGEDHQVYNNYFEGLAGTGSRSALSLMNGIPNSPLHGYFQVQRAVVAFNTFVDCQSNIVLGLPGKGAVLPPENCTIANNIVLRGKDPLVRLLNKASKVKWQGNYFHGATAGVPANPGIIVADPQLMRAADGLWRPDPGSPVIGAAMGDWPGIREDMDGQPRIGKRDVGSDQVSNSPVARGPLTAEKVGPTWLSQR